MMPHKSGVAQFMMHYKLGVVQFVMLSIQEGQFGLQLLMYQLVNQKSVASKIAIYSGPLANLYRDFF